MHCRHQTSCKSVSVKSEESVGGRNMAGVLCCRDYRFKRKR